MSQTDQSNRRKLHFENLDEVLADVVTLVNSEHHTIGNWSLSEILSHLQKTFDASFDGFGFQSNILMRKVLGILFKKRFLTKSLPAGFNLPKSASALIPNPEVKLAESLERFQSAIDRLKKEKPIAAHPGLGNLTSEEWIKLHLRHSELHLSFVWPAS